MKVGDLVKYPIYSDYRYCHWIIIEIDLTDVVWPYHLQSLSRPIKGWYPERELSLVGIEELSPDEFARLSTEDVFRLIREKLNESR